MICIIAAQLVNAGSTAWQYGVVPVSGCHCETQQHAGQIRGSAPKVERARSTHKGGVPRSSLELHASAATTHNICWNILLGMAKRPMLPSTGDLLDCIRSNICHEVFTQSDDAPALCTLNAWPPQRQPHTPGHRQPAEAERTCVYDSFRGLDSITKSNPMDAASSCQQSESGHGLRFEVQHSYDDR